MILYPSHKWNKTACSHAVFYVKKKNKSKNYHGYMIEEEEISLKEIKRNKEKARNTMKLLSGVKKVQSSTMSPERT